MQIPQTKGFVGRSSELIELSNLLDRNIIVIEGIAGIGKTYVASKFAEEIKDKYDIYWYGSLNEFTTIKSVINQISLFLKENGKSTLFDSINLGYETEILIDVLRNELNINKLAIFFDNYQKAEDELNPLIDQLLSIESSKLILITRKKPAFCNVLHERNNIIGKIIIDSWSYIDTFDMFNNRLIEIADDFILKKIHERLHGHPQYLNLFCILSQKSKPSELLMKLPKAEEDAHSYLESEIYNSLNKNEKTLIKIISVYRIPEKVDAFYIVDELKEVEETLDNLITKFLVNEVGVDKYFVHEIISSYCLNDAKKRKTLRDYHNNAAEYYLSKDKDPESLLEASYHYIQSEKREKSAEIVINNSREFIDKGFWNKIEELLNDAINTLSKRRHDKNAISGVGFAHLYIGKFYSQRGDLSLALEHAEKCSKCFIRTYHKNMFSLYTLLGEIYRKMGEINTSMKYFLKSLELAEKNDDEYTLAIANANIGNIHHERGEYEKALELYSKSRAFFETGNYTRNMADECQNIADVYYNLNNFNEAYKFIKQSINYFLEIGATYLVANVYTNYASYYIADPSKKDSLDKVLSCLEKNADTFNKIGHTRGEASVYSKIALIHKIKGNTILSNDYYVKTKEDLESVIKKYPNIRDELNLCDIYINLNDFGKAEIILRHMLNTVDDNHFFKPLILLYLSIVSFLIGNKTHASMIIEELTQKKSTLNKKCAWDFMEIRLTIKEKLEPYNYILISDLMSFTQNKTKFPLIHLDSIEIASEEVGSSAEVFHPFIGYRKITKDDTSLRNILKVLIMDEVIIDTDCAEIMEIERSSALITLGFLYRKGYINFSEISSNILRITLKDCAKNKLKYSR